MNLAQLLAQHLATPDRILYSQFEDGAWRDYSAAEVAQLVARWQQALRREGLQAGDRVALCLKNGVNWVALDLAALGLGLVVVPLYLDDNAENMAWCLHDSGARLLVLENARQCPGASRHAHPNCRLSSVCRMAQQAALRWQTGCRLWPRRISRFGLLRQMRWPPLCTLPALPGVPKGSCSPMATFWPMFRPA